MKRMMRAAAWLILIVMIALAPFLAASIQAERPDYVREQYTSWTGVLRLWKCEGWQAGNGSLTGWLNACIEKFEKRNPGVYVQMTDVSAETMAEFMSAGANPPDLILYAPGMLDAPYHLVQMEAEMPLRKTLNAFGTWQGARYAVPVALGGYVMAVNSELLPETAGNWRELSVIEKKDRNQQIPVLNAPADGAYTSWSAALISMFAGSCEQSGTDAPAPVGDGIDLGLMPGKAEPTERPDENHPEAIPNALPIQLPGDFRKTVSVYQRFASGEIAAMPVTQREIRRLQLLADTGKAPDWRAESIGLLFTDQAALVSAVAYEREDGKERQSLCMDLIHLMLTAEMQSKLTASRAFPVIDLPPLYGNQAGMREIEMALSGDDLLTPPAFGDEWREYAARLMDETGAGEGTQEAYERIREMMSRN